MSACDIRGLAAAARQAGRALALASSAEKNRALQAMAAGLVAGTERILAANGGDVAAAKAAGRSPAFVDRLTLSAKRIEAMARGVRQVADLPDPVGEITGMWRRPNGLLVGRMRVPLGVIGIIYESRPNVTADAAALCLKSGNAVILRGGREALASNRAIAEILSAGLASVGLPSASLAVVPSPDRALVKEMLGLSGLIDVIIPRGGEELIRAVRAEAAVPIIAHEKGLCHTYVDEGADLRMASEIAFNAKVERPGVCNAMETLLVHRDVAAAFLPGFVRRLQAAGVEVRGCPATRAIVPDVAAAAEADWDTEYLELILSVRVVATFEEAVAHIARHGSGLAEAIVTADHGRAMRFSREVDAAAVFVNASTRFTDGYEFGMGAEMGISTQKLHARGPMGLYELTCQKFVVLGEGQIRDSRA
ncbi:MAG: glutamate-5-semialdehyde dehydrogenase [candidate division NC10 bacterium]|nr:glutamate-5-semialdehyde dehydrogenase [candidate division NC10 bacterium]